MDKKLQEENLRIREELRNWKKKARTDSLTGLLNRSTFNEFSERLLEKSYKNNKPLSFIRVDIDDFKKINDTKGHEIGDKVLRETAKTIKETIRYSDMFSRKMVGRYGGEEIDIILPNTDEKGARIAGERIRTAIEDKFKNTDVKVTISAGVSTYMPKKKYTDLRKEVEKLVKEADDNVYKAKKSGKNKVIS